MLTADGVIGQFFVAPDGDMGEVRYRVSIVLYLVRGFHVDGTEDPRRHRGLNELERCRFFATRDDAQRARFDRIFLETGRRMIGATNGGPA